MVNIGFRPTVSDPDAPGRLSIEANIFDFIGYLYDEEVTVEFIRFLRDEKRFPSVEKLTEQLRADAAKARKPSPAPDPRRDPPGIPPLVCVFIKTSPK